MNKLFNLTTAAAMTLFFSSCVSNLSAPNRPSSAASAVSPAERVIAERVYALINNEREAAGEKMMRGHYGLNSLAQKHSLYMGSTLSDANHFGSENRAQYAYLKHSIENLSEMTYARPSGGSQDPAAESRRRMDRAVLSHQQAHASVMASYRCRRRRPVLTGEYLHHDVHGGTAAR